MSIFDLLGLPYATIDYGTIFQRKVRYKYQNFSAASKHIFAWHERFNFDRKSLCK